MKLLGRQTAQAQFGNGGTTADAYVLCIPIMPKDGDHHHGRRVAKATW